MFTPGLVKFGEKKAHVTFSDFYLRLNQTRPDWSVRALDLWRQCVSGSGFVEELKKVVCFGFF